MSGGSGSAPLTTHYSPSSPTRDPRLTDDSRVTSDLDADGSDADADADAVANANAGTGTGTGTGTERIR